MMHAHALAFMTLWMVTHCLGYDVSTIRAHNPDNPSVSWRETQDGVNFANVTIRDVIARAWDLLPEQIVGGQAWIGSMRWDILAKCTEGSLAGVPGVERRHQLRSLLETELHLKSHSSVEKGAVYYLLASKGGVRLRPLASSDKTSDNGLTAGNLSWDDSGAMVVVQAHAVPLERLTGVLSHVLGHPVVDRTGLPANASYDLKLQWSSEGNTRLQAEADAPSLNSALNEQLGMRLESAHDLLPTLVVDTVDRPSQDR